MPTSGEILMSKITNKSQWEKELPPEVVIKTLIVNFNGGKCQNHEVHILKFLLEENKTDKTVIHESVMELIKKSLTEWKFARTAVELVMHMQAICDDNISVKDHYIVNLQTTFEACQKNQTKDIDSWLGCISLLVHTSVSMVFKGGVPIRALLVKSQDCLKTLLDSPASYREIDCGCYLLDVCWDMMLKHNREGLQSLVPHIKEVVVSARGSQESRSSLIDKLIVLNSEIKKRTAK